jgi:hypothetical protein
MTPSPDVTPLRRDVSSSLEEFVRTLRQAFPQTLEEADPHYLARGGPAHGHAVLALELHRGPGRKIAGLSLPTLDVTIRFVEGSQDDCVALLAYLDRYLHKGGG